MSKVIPFYDSIQYWMAFLQRKFLSLTQREKFLLILFVLGLALGWLSFQMGRHKEIWSEISTAHSQARMFGAEIAVKESTDAEHSALMQEVPLQTLPSSVKVRETLDSLLRKYQFSDTRLDSGDPTEGYPLTFHSYSVDIRKANYSKLKEFIDELKQVLRHVSLSRITLQAERRTPQFLNVKIELQSIEYTP